MPRLPDPSFRAGPNESRNENPNGSAVSRWDPSEVRSARPTVCARYTVPSGRHVYAMDKTHPPALQVDAPARLTVQTLDCYNDEVTPDPASRRKVDQPSYNPAAGPIEVKGAAPGDVLAVRIIAVRPRPYGIVNVRPKRVGDEHLVAVLHVEVPDVPGAEPRVVWDRTATAAAAAAEIPSGAGSADGGVSGSTGGAGAAPDSPTHSMRLPYRPMIGVIGVAPAGAPVSTVTPDDHGGNMDVREIAPGSRLYLPVQVPGALLSLGDVHALMGDGETSGSGVEIAAEVELEVDISKETKLRRPLVETDAEWLFIASGPTLDDAAALAVEDAVAHLTRVGAIRRAEARLLIGQLGDLRVAQLVNPNKTVKLHIRKEHLRLALPQIAASGLAV